jgi:putative addiction module antidote
MELKVTKIGNSLGVILPRDLLAKLQLDKGDSIYLVATPEGFRMTSYDPAFAEQMDSARTLMRKRRNAINELSKS